MLLYKEEELIAAPVYQLTRFCEENKTTRYKEGYYTRRRSSR
jgi:hypothetical protein